MLADHGCSTYFNSYFGIKIKVHMGIRHTKLCFFEMHPHFWKNYDLMISSKWVCLQSETGNFRMKFLSIFMPIYKILFVFKKLFIDLNPI